MWKDFARRPIRALGFDLVRFRPDHFAARRDLLLSEWRVDAVLDVGAHVGEYAAELRARGFAGRIVSIEPSASTFNTLAERARCDDLWDAVQVALADVEGQAVLHTASNDVSSSLLALAPRAPSDLAYTADQDVEVARLDRHLPTLALGDDARLCLRVVVEGAELRVFTGAEDALQRLTVGLECELSLDPIYDGQPLLTDVVGFLAKRQFALLALRPAYVDTMTGHGLQYDGLFERV